MSKNVNQHDIVFALMVVGGHSVIGQILQKQAKAALLESFGVAGCVLIFYILHEIVQWVGRKRKKVSSRW